MASGPLQQVPSNAVDAAGLSVTTSVRSASDQRPGQIYDPSNLAGVVPVHFHPTTSPSMGGPNFLMLSRARWLSATSSASDPAAYSAYSVDSSPNWVSLNAASGSYSVVRSGYEIPMTTPSDTRTLTAAASRGVDMLWTLNSVVRGSDTSAVVQSWFYNQAVNTVDLRTEEAIPQAVSGADAVNFSAGLQWSSTTAPYMYLYGLGSSTNYVYAARKGWSRVGYTSTPGQPVDRDWEFFNGVGWGPDPTAVQPVQTVSGPMTSHGPLSFGHYAMQRAQRGMRRGLQGYSFVSSVTKSGNSYAAQVYSSLGGRPWSLFGPPIPLGAGSAYTGGTVQFQGHVGPNPGLVDSVNSATAIPYVYSTVSSSGGHSKLSVNWSLLQVPRLS